MAQAATSLRSVAWLTLLTLGQMALQFAFQILLAQKFGAESAMDAFVAAQTLPMVLSGIIAGAMASAFVPVYVETKERNGETAAWSMAVQVLCWVFLGTAVLWQSLWHFSEPVMRALHPGFDDLMVWDAEGLFRPLSSLLLWNSLAGVVRAWNHCLGRFAITGFAAMIGNAVMLWWAWSRAAGDGGMNEVAQAVVLGSIVTFAIQMPWVRLFARGWPASQESQAAVRRCFVLMLPLLAALGCTQLDPLVDRFLSSELSPGNVARLGYASRLAGALLTLAVSGLAVVVFPALAQHVAGHDETKLRMEIAAALRFLTLLLTPVVVALVGFGQPLIHDLLERGRFTAEDTRVVALLLALLAGQIVAGSAGEIAAKIFFARQSMRVPVLLAFADLGLAVALKFWWVRQWGVAGLAVATAVFYCVSAGVMWGCIGRQYGRSILSGVLGSLIRAIIASAAAAAIGWWILRSAGAGKIPCPAFCGGLAGGVVYGIALALMRDEIAWRALRMFGIGRSIADVNQEPIP